MSDENSEQSSGQPTSGQSSDGQPTGGQSSGGQGQPTGGQSSDGQGQPTGGQSTGGQGQPNGGQQAAAPGQQPAAAGQGGTVQGSGHGEVGGTSGTGLDPNVAGAVAYVFGLLSGIVMLVVEDDEFVQFHAKQSIAVTIVLTAAWFVLAIITAVLTQIPVVGGIFSLLSILLYPLLGLAGLAVWVFLIYKAYQGEWYKLPVIGDIAANN